MTRLPLPYFCTISHKTSRFSKKKKRIIEYKICVLTVSTKLSEIFLTLRRIRREKIITEHTSSYSDIFPTRCNITQFIYFWKTALHISGGIFTHHQERTQTYLQHLVLVTPLLLPAASVEELELRSNSSY